MNLSEQARKMLDLLCVETQGGTRPMGRARLTLLATTSALEISLSELPNVLSELVQLGFIALSDERVEVTAAGRGYLLDNFMSEVFATRSQRNNVCPVQTGFLVWLYRQTGSGDAILSDPEGYEFNVDDCIDLLDYACLVADPSDPRDYRNVTHVHNYAGDLRVIILKELREFGFIEQFAPDGPEPVPPECPRPRPGTLAASIDASATQRNSQHEKWFSTGPVRLTAAGAKVAQQEQAELDAPGLRRELLNWIKSAANPTYSTVAISNFFSQDRAFWWFGRRSVEVSGAVEFLVREELAETVAAEHLTHDSLRSWPNVRITQLGLRCVEEFGGDSRAMREGNTGFNIGVLHLGDQNDYSGGYYSIDGSATGAIGPNAKAENFTIQVNERQDNTDLTALARELAELKERLLEKAESGRELATVSEIQLAIEATAAEVTAAKKRDAVQGHLAKAGRWALDVAREIGSKLAVAALESALRIGS